MTAAQNSAKGVASNGYPGSSSSSGHMDHHHHHHLHSQSHPLDHSHHHRHQHGQELDSQVSAARASSSRHTLDPDEAFVDQSHRSKQAASESSHSQKSSSRRRGSGLSPPSSPYSPSLNEDIELDPPSQSSLQHFKGSQEAAGNNTSTTEHPATSAMATLSVNTPPATFQPDPMLHAPHTNSPLHKSASAFHQHQHSSSPALPPAPYTQPPVTSSLADVTSGDGWSIVPKCARTHAAASTTVASPGASSVSQAQQSAASDLIGLSQAAYAHAANDASNRRCGPTELSSSFDVPFGERASPAIISLNQRGARSLSRTATRPPSPLTLSPAMAKEDLNPSGAHRGGLRGSDEDVVETAEKDVAMCSAEEGCNTTGATPLVPPATRKLCVRHQRMADEGTTARLQKVSSKDTALLPFSFPTFGFSPSLSSDVQSYRENERIDVADPTAPNRPFVFSRALVAV